MSTTTFRLRVWTRFYAPPERVWELKTDPAALSGEFPLWMAVSFGDGAAFRSALMKGAGAELSGRVGPIPWPSKIEAVEAGHRFRESSTNAIFSRYEHEHLVEETPDGARYIDDIVFTPRTGLNKLTAIALQRTFQHRHRMSAIRLPADTRTVGTAVLRVLVEELTPTDED